ncbi:hypothetical protein [Desulfuribacillus alkaliarsenatis]|uniref:DUF8042 domain-containing protein n=1 Tax=Desulfuribacillus alkaliarsenatis TaxID=766136 RepID=A0A1E5G3R2_9FIRM|nr:hypothetical protein [Desulfuribacillus alkaliarsenatis]OEF97713.1 hypothetical protein BHF68_14030 [Desulfuribacillus alkaliarsenatis]
MDIRQQQNELMDSIIDYLPKLIVGVSDAVSNYQSGQEGKANELMIDIVDGLKWLSEALTLTISIQKDPIDLSELHEHFNEMISAYENTDYVLLGDILEYEILPILEKWNEKLAV